MDDADLCYAPLTKVAERIRAGELSPLDLTRRLIERIENCDSRLRSYVTLLTDRAVAAARAAEQEIHGGRYRGPLHGVPIAVKDLCWTRGIRTTCASRLLEDWRPEENATVVERLESAGAVLLGKLNMTEFAMAWYHPSLPPVTNPWNPEMWPGTSSSGSGAATAAGLCFGSLGTDTGGSIRFPAAACGVVGLKPTYGRVSRYGVCPLGESLDHIGPLTRTVADAAVMLQAIAGFDPKDPTSRREAVDDYRGALERGVRGVRIGLDEKYISAGCTPEVSAAVLDAARTLERQGARLVAVEVPDVNESLSAWVTLCAAEAMAAHGKTFPSRAEDYGPGFRSFLDLGSCVRGEDYARAHAVREIFAGRFGATMEAVDVLVCPAMPMPGVPAAMIAPDAKLLIETLQFQCYASPFNLSRHPTLTLPCGFSADRLPIGLQLVARHLEEAVLCQVGHAYEQATEWYRQRPPI